MKVAQVELPGESMSCTGSGCCKGSGFSRGVKGNSWACSKRLTWRDKKRYDYCILHGTSLRTASPVV